jgi:phosphatidylserine synthase
VTITRLVFFTLSKSAGDPAFFAGVPSTIGAIIALTSLLLFPDSPAIVGLFVGVAVVLMVSFDSAYRHLGRLVLGAPRAQVAIGITAAIVILGGSFVFGRRAPIATVLAASVAYGFAPQVTRLARVTSARRRTPENPDTT